MPTYLINGSSPASLGLANPRLSYGSLMPDVLKLEHLTAAWDADPIFTYGQQIVLTLDGVTVFVGKVRTFPRFAGPTAETTSYEVLGPFDWLQRRALLQNQAVVVAPATSTIPTLVPQGLAILGQSDAGTSVLISAALVTIIDQAIAAGVPILRGSITGFDYAIAWDEVADLTIADAIVRLLGSSPDAVVFWDYTTTTTGSPTPTIKIGRRSNLTATSLSIAPAGAGGTGSYALFESLRLTSRPDLVVPGVFINYRRINTVNGSSYLAIDSQTAGSGTASAENALCRTVTLAGSAFTSNTVEQACVTAAIPSSLGSGVLTPASGSSFTSVLAFLARSNKWLLETGTSITKLTPSTQYLRALAPNSSTGVMEEVSLHSPTLVRELTEGAITTWMRDTTLNRVAQEQEVSYEVEGTRTIAGTVSDAKGTVTRAFLATNASTQTYSFQESSSFTPQEPTPSGLAAALYAAMSGIQHEGSFTLVESECTLAIRPGKVVNLTGGRSEWTTMAAMVQQISADLETGKTEIQVGFPNQLGPADLVEIYRANRFKRGADRSAYRATGKF